MVKYLLLLLKGYFTPGIHTAGRGLGIGTFRMLVIVVLQDAILKCRFLQIEDLYPLKLENILLNCLFLSKQLRGTVQFLRLFTI